MKILYILRHNPWGIGGGCYACRNYLEVFSCIFSDTKIDVCICAEYLSNANMKEFPNINFIGISPRKSYSKFFTPITGILHRHHKTSQKLLSENNYDYCIFDHSSIAGSLCKTCKKKNIKTIVINHNCEYDYSKDNTPNFIKRLLLLPMVRRNEKKAFKICNYNIFLTQEDYLQFEYNYGLSSTKSMVCGCFNKKDPEEGKLQPTPFHNKDLRIIISGTIGNIQNMDGILYFLKELYSVIPPTIEIIIAGKNPPEYLYEMTKKCSNITIIPNPNNINKIVNECDIFLCPTKIGGGLKLRIMDGLNNGLPVISHAVSARGYSAFIEQSYLYKYETKDEFETVLINLITRIQNEGISKKEIQEFSQKKFSFKQAESYLRSQIRNIQTK